jgi:hypothetical protein
MATPLEEMNEALARAAIACAERARTAAESGGQGTVGETWAAAAAQLAYAANASAGALPARPGLG